MFAAQCRVACRRSTSLSIATFDMLVFIRLGMTDLAIELCSPDTKFYIVIRNISCVVLTRKACDYITSARLKIIQGALTIIGVSFIVTNPASMNSLNDTFN
jgi:hypothetical protein